jgi:hypothetical protein
LPPTTSGARVGIISVLPARERLLPELLAGGGVERDEVGVEGGEVDLVLPERDAPVRRMHGDQPLRQFEDVAPEFRALHGVKGDDLVVSGRHDHHAIVDQRRRLDSPDRREAPRSRELLARARASRSILPSAPKHSPG